MLRLVLTEFEMMWLAQRIAVVAVGFVLVWVVKKWWTVRITVLMVVLVFTIVSAEKVLAPGWIETKYHQLVSWTSAETQGIPALVKSEADRYLISRVGGHNFSRMFVFDGKASIVEEDSALRRSFLVAYHFVPMKTYIADDIVFVRVENDSAKEAPMVPDCLLEAKWCDFRLTKNQLAGIISQEGMELNVPLVRMTKIGRVGLGLMVSDCVAKRKVVIDYHTARVVGESVVEKCGE